MPVMDGFEATRRVRASGAPYAGIPIIALTASATPEHLARCEAAGMDAHLAKPLSPLALEAVLRRYLGETAAPAAALGPPKAAREELVEQFGPHAVIKLLALLLEQLGSKLRVDVEPDRLREDAHALAGAAGMMGYDTLSAACRDLEQALEDGRDHELLLSQVRAMIDEATVDATAWTADLEARASVAA
jgi:HPt (histidine-containing phosphotransfer) domain-containing protein